MLQQELDKLCERIAGCETLAYVDLSTQMVLITNASSPESQDSLNTLCRDAGVLLADGSSALIGSANRFQLFLRAADVPTDVMCCLCTLDTDMAALMPAAQDCLNAFSAGETTDG